MHLTNYSVGSIDYQDEGEGRVNLSLEQLIELYLETNDNELFDQHTTMLLAKPFAGKNKLNIAYDRLTFVSIHDL